MKKILHQPSDVAIFEGEVVFAPKKNKQFHHPFGDSQATGLAQSGSRCRNTTHRKQSQTRKSNEAHLRGEVEQRHRNTTLKAEHEPTHESSWLGFSQGCFETPWVYERIPKNPEIELGSG